MRKLSTEELKTIIANHQHWIAKDCEGWEKMKADLSFCDLAGCDLQNVRLNGASLKRASLDGASLKRASLDGASLDGASLKRASLDGASLKRASLNGASLNWASLDGASLNWASLDGASLNGASLNWASLNGVKGLPFIPLACPDSGAFIGWKKVNGYIVKLQIPEDAKRSSAATRKCRCDKALVLAIEKADGTDSGKTTLTNWNYAETVYTVGEMVYPDSWDDNRWNECSHGLHFFINRQEAVNW